MTVKQLKDELEKFDDNVEVLTEKTELFGNVAFVHSVRKDSYSLFDVVIECVLLTDDFMEEGDP